jgi:hypothetical protein
VGGSAPVIGDVLYVSVPCPLCCCPRFVDTIHQAKVLAVSRPSLIAEVLYGAGPVLHGLIVLGEQPVFVRAVQAAWYRACPPGAMGIGCRKRWSVPLCFVP